DQIQRFRLRGRVLDGRLAPTLLAAALQAVQAHQPPHPPPPAHPPASEQLVVHPGRAVGAVGVVVDLPDRLEQLTVGYLPGRGDVLLALVVGGTGDLEQFTGVLDAVTGHFLRLDEAVQLHRVSLAKKAVARLSTSTSACNRALSRRSRESSSRS